MGNVQQQIQEFYRNVDGLITGDTFAALCEKWANIINPDLLKDILLHMRNIPAEQLAEYELGMGEMLLRADTNLKFTFYLGRDFNGEFQFVITHNGKQADGTEGKARIKKSGSYKVGKLAAGLDLVNSTAHNMFRLTMVDCADEAQSEHEFSMLVDSPFVARYFSSYSYTKNAIKTDNNTDNQTVENDTTSENDSKVAVFVKYAEKGDLYTWFKDQSLKFNSEDRLVLIFQALAGMRHMHSYLHATHPVCHRDIKTLNMVVGADWRLRHIDFGGWQKYDKDARTYEYCPPEYYESDARASTPEVLLKSNYNISYAKDFWKHTAPEQRAKWDTNAIGTRSDVWSAGICCYEILTQGGVVTHDLLAALSKDKWEYIHAMLEVDPLLRCNADTALQLFLEKSLSKYSFEIQTGWLLRVLALYENDFQRMQFFSELHHAGRDDLIALVPADKRANLDYNTMLDWRIKMSLTEWYRIRDYYKLSLTAGELRKFDLKLKARPELAKELIGATFMHAARNSDGKVVSLFYNRRYDLSNYFSKLDAGNAIDLGAKGISPFMFAGKYTAAKTAWWLKHGNNTNLILNLLMAPTIHPKKLTQVIKVMLAHKCHQYWQAALGVLYKTNNLNMTMLNALRTAGVTRTLICDYLYNQLDFNENNVELLFGGKYMTWICAGGLSADVKQSISAVLSKYIANNSMAELGVAEKASKFKFLTSKYVKNICEITQMLQTQQQLCLDKLKDMQSEQNHSDDNDDNDEYVTSFSKPLLNFFNRLTLVKKRTATEVANMVLAAKTIADLDQIIYSNPHMFEPAQQCSDLMANEQEDNKRKRKVVLI